MKVGDAGLTFSFLAGKLQSSRRERGWSRTELAARIGRTADELSAIEGGVIQHELGTIYLICHELGLSFRELFAAPQADAVIIPFPHHRTHLQ